jgi:hypothetical protein
VENDASHAGQICMHEENGIGREGVDDTSDDCNSKQLACISSETLM